MVSVISIRDESEQLNSVKALWRENSRTLGYFPSGAFAERARKGQILAAFDGELILGYVLFYSGKNSRIRIRIFHGHGSNQVEKFADEDIFRHGFARMKHGLGNTKGL